MEGFAWHKFALLKTLGIPSHHWQDVFEWLPMTMIAIIWFKKKQKEIRFSMSPSQWFINSFFHLFIILSLIWEVFSEYLLCVDISSHLLSIWPSTSPPFSFWDINFPPLFEALVGWEIEESLSRYRCLRTSRRPLSPVCPFTTLKYSKCQHPT